MSHKKRHKAVEFWDRDYGGHDEVGEKLTKASEKLGEQYAMVGDNGQIYLEGGR